MKITLHPCAALPGAPDDAVSVSGETITVNGTAYDLSSVPEGGEAEAQGDHPFAGPITRTGGVLTVPLVYRYSTATAEPNQPTDPAHWIVDITSGALPDKIARLGDLL